MPTSSSQVRASQHEFTLMNGNSWIEEIGMSTKEGDTIAEMRAAPEVPIDLTGAIITLTVFNPITQENVWVLDNDSLGGIEASDEGTNYFKINVLEVVLAKGSYRYYLTVEFPGEEIYDYLVGPLTVKTPH